MGFRRQEAFKLLPGVRVTVGDPSSGADRRLWLRAAVPGREVDRRTVLPGPTAPRWERRLHRSLMAGDVDGMRAAAPRRAPLTAALAGLVAATVGAYGADRARALLDEAWRSEDLLEDQPFVRRYLAHATVSVPVAGDVSALFPVCRDVVGLWLVALARSTGHLDEAVGVAEELDPSVLAAMVLADCYALAARHDDVVAVTSGISNSDDATALLLVQRGLALRALGRTAAADEAFDEAVRPVVRSPAVRSYALAEWERGREPGGDGTG